MFDTAEHFLCQDKVKSLSFPGSTAQFPMKLMRYWITGNLLLNENRKLRIAEIGIDRGQMKFWMNNIGFADAIRWDGYDISHHKELDEAAYTAIYLGDVTGTSWRPQYSYDCLIALHFLEHLENPEAFIKNIDPYIEAGGVIVGGMPSTPEFLRAHRERKLRKKAKQFGHVSAFSRTRIENMAKNFGYQVEFISGGFFARFDNTGIENSRQWFDFNRWFASKTCSVGNEIYFKIRKQID